MSPRMISLGTACLFTLTLANAAIAGDTPQVAAGVEQDANSPASGSLRIDTDAAQTQVGVGATHSLAGFDLASGITLVGAFAQFDAGPAFTFGNVTISPMVGVCFDFETTNIASVIAPQLFVTYDGDKLYAESWLQSFFNTPFDHAAEDSAYTRNFLLYKASEDIHVGPQLELSYRFNNRDMMLPAGVTSLPMGLRVNLGYGRSNTLGVFLGYDTKTVAGSDGIAGRFTFIRGW